MLLNKFVSLLVKIPLGPFEAFSYQHCREKANFYFFSRPSINNRFDSRRNIPNIWLSPDNEKRGSVQQNRRIPYAVAFTKLRISDGLEYSLFPLIGLRAMRWGISIEYLGLVADNGVVRLTTLRHRRFEQQA